MTAQHWLLYQGYLLDCEPLPLVDGRYSAEISIEGQTGIALIEKRSPSLEVFSNKEDAIEYARRWGEAWIDDNEAPRLMP